MNTKSDSSFKTDSLMVIRGGQTAFEYYDGFYKPDVPHSFFSASKTVTAALAGVAVQDGLLSMDQKVVDIFPQAAALHKTQGDTFDQITLKDLLVMGSGITWAEAEGLALRKQVGLRMIFTDGPMDALSFIFSQPMDAAGRGNVWKYNSGDINVLMGAVQKAYGQEEDTMPWKRLFDRLGMKNVIFQRDAAGTFIGSGYLFATLRDQAKIGELLLADGVWNGERILPVGWVDMLKTVSYAVKGPGTSPEAIKSQGVYGGGLWVNQPVPEKGLEAPLPNVPTDVYYALGVFGQMVVVFPSLNMVIARTGHDVEYHSRIDGFLSRAIACFAPNGGAL